MARFRHSFTRAAGLMLLGFFIAACSGGDDGSDGAAGPAGPPGGSGPSGGTAEPVDSADIINIAVTAVDVPAGGGAPTVSLALTNDLGIGLTGMPANEIRFILAQLSPGTGGGSSEWQSYITTDTGGIVDGQATAERAQNGTFIDNGDGTYTYTFASDLTAYPAGPVFDATKTHRLGIELRGDTPNANNGIFDFVPAGGAPVFERKIVDNDTCNACHDRLEFHGGPRTDVEYCVTCHNPSSVDGDTGNSVDMKILIHNIHAGRDGYVIEGYRGTVYDFSDIVWTQDVRNCGTCHEESDANTPQASNYRTVINRAACGTCHYDDGDDTNDTLDYMIETGDHPFGQQFADDTQCEGCHGPNSPIPAVQIPNAHIIPTLVESGRFQFNIVDVFDMGVGLNPTVHISVTNPLDGTAYDILNDVEFTTCAFGASRLAVSIAWDTADYRNTGSGSNPAQPISMDPLTCNGPGATPVAGSPGVFAVTSATAIPANAAGTTAAVTIDGHPAVTIGTSVERIPVKNVVEYVGVDGATNPDRRTVVDIDKCDDCHKQLSLHGNNRTDNPQVCVVCHNPNATDARQRVPVANPDDPPTDCVNVLGDDDAPIDFKVMIHSIHASGARGVPYEVCGFRNSVHVYDVHYPGHVNNCDGCHMNKGNIRDTYYPVAPGAILGTTVDVGADVTTPIDDTVISPNTAVCSTCHVSALAAQHMIQNGGDFAATKAADSSLISSGVETCQLCHGPGRSADVKEMHGVDEFQFN